MPKAPASEGEKAKRSDGGTPPPPAQHSPLPDTEQLPPPPAAPGRFTPSNGPQAPAGTAAADAPTKATKIPPPPGAGPQSPAPATETISPAAAIPPPPPAACPSCGATLSSGQLFCVDCGARTGLDWRRPSGWRAPVAIAAVTLIALGVAAGLIASEVSDDEEVTAKQANAEPEQPAAPPAPTPAPAPPAQPPAPAPGAETPAPPATPAQPEPPAGGAPGQDEPASGNAPQTWPAGKSAYTVILLSTDQRVGADRKANEVAAAGLPAGVLRSNDYPSLRPGYWVVFVGQYDSLREASRRADRIADRGFPGGYPRYVESR
jgi:hypothetical protein